MNERDTILVTGSRDWDDIETMRAWLEPALKRHPRLVEGGARGADDMAFGIANECNVEDCRRYRVDEALDGPWPAAGPRRNARMVAAEVHRIRRAFAFTTGPALTKGSRHCVDCLIALGIPVTIVTKGARP